MRRVRRLSRGYSKLGEANRVLEQKVFERTAELRQSEAGFQRFTELSSDWYWEQDAEGELTAYSGPVRDMLGLGGDAASWEQEGWDVAALSTLADNFACRRPFLDFIYSRRLPDGRAQTLQVSGEPVFDSASRFIGYRGVGMDVSERIG